MKFAALVLPAAFAVGAASAEVQFDAAQTRIEFALGATLHTVHGTFQPKSGSLRFDPATGAASGTLVVNAVSGNSGNQSRDHRMHEKILESAAYPEITFTPDRVTGALNAQGDSTVQVHGLFGIHGARHEVTIPFQVHAAGGQIQATGSFPVPYVKWGMKNASTLLLRVSDTVQIQVHAVGQLK